MQRNLHYWRLLILLLVVCSLVNNFSSTWAQDIVNQIDKSQSQKLIDREDLVKNSPLKIQAVKVRKGAQLRIWEFGKKARASKEWLEGLIFEVKNVSNKPIKYFELQLDFPDIKMLERPAMGSLEYGLLSIRDGHKLGNEAAPLLMPGQTATLIFAATEARALQNWAIAQGNSQGINAIKVRLGLVAFDSN
jgi:hypothetical protein